MTTLDPFPASRTTVSRVPTRLGSIAYRRVGSGPVAVLWHSMFADGSSWNALLPALSRHRTIIVVDGPGYGASDPLTRPTTIDESAEAAAELIRAVSPHGPVDWVGNAWGGHAGMSLAANHPDLVSSLVLVSSPVQPIDRELRRKVRLLNQVLRVFGPVDAVESAVLQNQLTDRNQRDLRKAALITEAMARVPRRSLAMTVRSFILGRTDASAHLPRIAVPTLLVTGDDRPEWTPELMEAAARRIPNASTLVIPGSRTVLPVEVPEELAAAIVAFWSGPASPR